MASSRLRIVCWIVLVLSLGSAALAAFSPARGALLVALWIGGFLPQVAFAIVQSLPGGRLLLPLLRDGREDGWLIALVASVVCAEAVVMRDDVAPGAVIPAIALLLASAGLLFARVRQLHRAADLHRGTAHGS